MGSFLLCSYLRPVSLKLGSPDCDWLNRRTWGEISSLIGSCATSVPPLIGRWGTWLKVAPISCSLRISHFSKQCRRSSAVTGTRDEKAESAARRRAAAAAAARSGRRRTAGRQAELRGRRTVGQDHGQEAQEVQDSRHVGRYYMSDTRASAIHLNSSGARKVDKTERGEGLERM
ncbi:hypothetical protein MHYP_G00142210 [Metynnis hypsauchen]